METEIRVYILTKLLKALYNKDSKVLEALREMFGDSEIWDYWLERYDQLAQSKELRLLVMRKAGMSYRKIQELENVSPNKISFIVHQFELDYEPLLNSKQINSEMKKIDERLKELNIELW